MGGRLVSFMGGWYHATKYAVEAFSDALRMEVKQFGIDVILIEPGGIKTDWGHIAADHLADSAKGGAYEKTALKVAEGMHKQYNGNMMSKPQVVVKATVKAVNARRPKPRYLIGFGPSHWYLPTPFCQRECSTLSWCPLLKSRNVASKLKLLNLVLMESNNF